MNSVKNDTSFVKSTVQILWLGILSCLLIASALFVFISLKLMPDTNELENPKYEIATSILDDSGKEISRIYKLNREWISYEKINPNLIKALIATEDIRFLEHSGIDARGTLRAIVFMGKKGGASTITQQLAKQFFTNRSRNFVKRVWQKMREWAITVEFEKRYTKQEIIAMYLNKAEFLFNAIGIGSAAQTYFGKNQENLNIDECAILVAMLKNPGLYNPVKFPENCFNRRNVVLNQMRKAEFINQTQYEDLKTVSIDMSNFKTTTHYNGNAPYFRAKLIAWTKDLLSQDKYRKSDGSKYDVFTDGLKIYTTINSKMQSYAHSSMKEHMASLQNTYENSIKYDPWEKGGSKESIKKRQDDLLRSIRSTDRYAHIRKKYFNPLVQEISPDISDVRLWNTDIFRLYAGEKDGKYLSKLEKKGDITKKQLSTYRKILKSEHWKKIKGTWQQLKKAVKKNFNTKVKMKVFDHKKGEKIVVMTPLDSIKYHQKQLQIGSVAVDSKTGHIKSWVGGIDFKYFQYDHVESNRQVGSTFKPFIYSTAIIDLGMSPCQKIQDIKYTIPANDDLFELQEAWAPDNSDKKNTGEWMTLKQCLKESKNSCSVYLMKEIGSTERVRDFVDNLGIDKSKIPNYPSICLGTPGLSVMDMATAYTAFANDGVMTKPIFVTKIEDENGKLVYSDVPKKKKVINPEYNSVIVNMMQHVVSNISSQFKNDIAGKTGTTDDYRDGWFMGYTPDLVVGTWVGGEKQWIRFDNIAQGQGAVMARPFFQKFMSKVEKDNSLPYSKSSYFFQPENPIIETNCDKYITKDTTSTKQVELLEEEF